MRIDIDKIKKDSAGKWLGIFNSLGIDVPEVNIHGPCPICGGKDRFRLKRDAAETGRYFCNQCQDQTGDGWSLVQRSLGLTFMEAVNRVSKIVGAVEIDNCTQPKCDPEKRRKMLSEIWHSSVPLSEKNMAVEYLHARGLYMMDSAVLRFCRKCYNSENKSEMPALVAKFSGADGSPVALQRTYLTGPSKADLKSPRMTLSIPGKRMAGGAVRLYTHGETLGIAEGIEDAISTTQLFDIPTWATLSNTLLEAWVPPESARKIVVFGDADANFAGQGSAYKLANKLYVKHKRIVEVRIPDNFKDWNEELMYETHKAKQIAAGK